MISKTRPKSETHAPQQRSYGSSERVEKVIDFILTGVKLGSFAPGQRIAEVEIIHALGIKRAPIREALRILAGEGVIELRRNVGARIRRISKEDIKDLIAVLTALNDISLVLAVSNHTAGELMRQLDPFMRGIKKASATRSHSAVLVAVEEYHQKIHELGGSKYINYLWRRLHIAHYHRSLEIELRVIDWRRYTRDIERAHESLRVAKLAAARKYFRARAAYIDACLS